MAQEYIMSAAGKRELEERYDQIRLVEMPAIVEEIAKARAQGDLSENAEYQFAREAQAQLQNELDTIKEKLAYAKIIDEKAINDDVVSIGCTVKVIEADIADGLEEVEKLGLSRTDVIAGFLSRMSVNDMRARPYKKPILAEFTDEDYKTAAGELVGSKRFKKEVLIEKGFSEEDLANKIKTKTKLDKNGKYPEYTIVGSHEADAINGLISNESRVGSALLGKDEGDVVMVGDLIFKIVDIRVDKSKK